MSTSQPPHSKDLRKGRVSQQGRIYLVTTRCNGGQPLFTDESLGQIVMEEGRRLDDAGQVRTFALVVMPDHLHWLFELSGTLLLSSAVKQLKGRASRRINLARGKTARVWQPGFHDRALRRAETLQDAGYYVINNPVRAGLVTHYSEYALLYAAWL